VPTTYFLSVDRAARLVDSGPTSDRPTAQYDPSMAQIRRQRVTYDGQGDVHVYSAFYPSGAGKSSKVK